MAAREEDAAKPSTAAKGESKGSQGRWMRKCIHLQWSIVDEWPRLVSVDSGLCFQLMSNLLIFDIAVYDSSDAYVIFVISATWDSAVVLVPY